MTVVQDAGGRGRGGAPARGAEEHRRVAQETQETGAPRALIALRLACPRVTPLPLSSLSQAKPPAPIKKEPAPAAASSAADPKAAVKAGSSGLVPMDVPPMAAASSTLAPARVAAVQLPEAGRPCLQSTRLFSVDPSMGAAGAALSKNLIRKATGYLAEVGLPPKPMPTRAVCDLVDAIRRDTVALLSLHNAINKREKSLSAAAAAAMGISAGPSVSAGGGATVKAEKASKGEPLAHA